MIGKLSAKELQDRGVLAKCHVNIVQLKDKVEFANYQSELKHLLEDSTRLDTIAALILKVNETGNTLVLVDRVNAGKELVSRLPNAVFVSGGTGLTERKAEYDEVATFPVSSILFLSNPASLLFALFNQSVEVFVKQKTRIMSKFGISLAPASSQRDTSLSESNSIKKLLTLSHLRNWTIEYLTYCYFIVII